MTTDSFRLLPFNNKPVFDDETIQVSGIECSPPPGATRERGIGCEGTIFFAVAKGTVAVDAQNDCGAWLQPGMYGCVPKRAYFQVKEGRVITIIHKHYQGMFTVGGPIEQNGRLKYISGCTDTTLISPLVQGDPCMNYLYFPPQTVQATHYHPSHRIGMIFGGKGWCHTPVGSTLMNAGDAFIIPQKSLHSFQTEDDCMRIIVFHPDSAWGPTDKTHQMLDATLEPA